MRKTDYDSKTVSPQKHKRSIMHSFNTSLTSQFSTRNLVPKTNRRRRSEESSLCYKLVSNDTVNGYSGNPITIFRNGIDVGIALDAQAISQRTCFTDILPNDKLRFQNGGSNGVYIQDVFVNDTKINDSPFWVDGDDIGNGNYIVTPYFVIQENEIVMNQQILNNSKSSAAETSRLQSCCSAESTVGSTVRSTAGSTAGSTVRLGYDIVAYRIFDLSIKNVIPENHSTLKF